MTDIRYNLRHIDIAPHNYQYFPKIYLMMMSIILLISIFQSKFFCVSSLWQYIVFCNSTKKNESVHDVDMISLVILFLSMSVHQHFQCNTLNIYVSLSSVAFWLYFMGGNRNYPLSIIMAT